jgi:hypothetical protein
MTPEHKKQVEAQLEEENRRHETEVKRLVALLRDEDTRRLKQLPSWYDPLTPEGDRFAQVFLASICGLNETA